MTERPWNRVTDIRLDPLGGVSGDMFVGAATDTWPALADLLERTIGAFPFPPGCKAVFGRANRGGLSAATFQLSVSPGAGLGAHSYLALRDLFAAAPLPQPIRTHALGIYDLLARAEAAVHGVAVAETHFHELGDWDSVADVLCAAAIINALPEVRWHIEPLPLGHGSIATAHGRLTAPAPATAWLLREFRCHDDGIPGERVTPTGAAILRYLNAASDRPSGSFELLGTGCGAGSIELPGVPNVLRLLPFARTTAQEQGSVVVVRFEVDDQTPEDLAIGLDRVRALPGVLDVVMWSASGKKGRMIFAVQVIAQNERHAEAIQACLAETATIGVRWQQASRSVLPRTESVSVGTEGRVRVKRVRRPGGTETRKAEADDIGQLSGDYAARSSARKRAEEDTDESA